MLSEHGIQIPEGMQEVEDKICIKCANLLRSQYINKFCYLCKKELEGQTKVYSVSSLKRTCVASPYGLTNKDVICTNCYDSYEVRLSNAEAGSIVAFILGVCLAFVGLGVAVWGLLLPVILAGQYMIVGIIVLIVGAVILYMGYKMKRRNYLCGVCRYQAESERELNNHLIQHKNENTKI